MPTYLIAERGVNLKAVGYLTPISFIASFLSTVVCGWVMNKYFDKKENWMIVICAAMTAIFLYFMNNAETIMWVVIFQRGVYFFKACILGTAVAIVLKIVTGSIAGCTSTLINMGGQVAGFISSIIMGYLFYTFNGSFNAVFYYLMVVAALCAISALLIPTRKEDMLRIKTKILKASIGEKSLGFLFLVRKIIISEEAGCIL